MQARRKLIVVSNRGPISYAREGGERIARRGAGGLVTALAPLVSHHDVTWIASALSDEDRTVAAEGAVDTTAADGSRYRLRLVAHEPAAFDLYYNVVANPALWFVQHGLWQLKHDPGRDLRPAWDEGYAAVNATFAAAVVEELERDPGTAVFFHDYHLYLAPKLVREQRPDTAMAHFTHIPWVGREEWSVLPDEIVGAIHESLLSCDVVSFHTHRWRTAFLATCAELGLDADDTLVSAHPISIDPDEFTALAASEPVLERERELARLAPGDADSARRPDRSGQERPTGPGGVRALLERRPELRGRVRDARVARPVAPGDPRVHRGAAADRGGGRDDRGTLPGRPPAADRRRLSPSIAAYKQFDVLLVNAVMDGLNLVVKEASYVNAREGAVVLSVNAGALEEIGSWVVPVDPFDVEGQADALEAALALPEEERRSRLEAIRQHIRATTCPVDRRAAFRPRPRQYDARAMSDLSHVDESGAVRMVDVGSKPMSRRRAIARAFVRMAPETPQRLGDLPKGDALTTAQLAGIMAAKRTSDLIPLCHPLPLTVVDVTLAVVADGVEITATAETTAQTGVEMEALVAASVAALTVYDMTKAIDKGMVITDVTLVEKTKADV